MSFKNWLRSVSPTGLLEWNRARKKKKVNRKLSEQATAGESFSKDYLLAQLKKVGIESGDCLLVHSSLSRMGHLKDGPKTFTDAVIEAVGPEGHVLMPTSPNHVYQLNYIRNTPFFDVLNSPSKTGAITEYFRKLPGAKRSLHPTEPVSVIGPNAEAFIKGHFKAITPYNSESPFAKVAANNGKILYVGVTLDNAGTSLHTLEDAIADFKYPVYYPEIFSIEVIDENGNGHNVQTKVHNPEFSKLRQCDQLIPHFERAGVLEHVKIGNADSLLVDAQGFFDCMVEMYHSKGITMYTPNGEAL